MQRINYYKFDIHNSIEKFNYYLSQLTVEILKDAFKKAADEITFQTNNDLFKRIPVGIDSITQENMQDVFLTFLLDPKGDITRDSYGHRVLFHTLNKIEAREERANPKHFYRCFTLAVSLKKLTEIKEVTAFNQLCFNIFKFLKNFNDEMQIFSSSSSVEETRHIAGLYLQLLKTISTSPLLDAIHHGFIISLFRKPMTFAIAGDKNNSNAYLRGSLVMRLLENDDALNLNDYLELLNQIISSNKYHPGNKMELLYQSELVLTNTVNRTIQLGEQTLALKLAMKKYALNYLMVLNKLSEVGVNNPQCILKLLTNHCSVFENHCIDTYFKILTRLQEQNIHPKLLSDFIKKEIKKDSKSYSTYTFLFNFYSDRTDLIETCVKFGVSKNDFKDFIMKKVPVIITEEENLVGKIMGKLNTLAQYKNNLNEIREHAKTIIENNTNLLSPEQAQVLISELGKACQTGKPLNFLTEMTGTLWKTSPFLFIIEVLKKHMATYSADLDMIPFNDILRK